MSLGERKKIQYELIDRPTECGIITEGLSKSRMAGLNRRDVALDEACRLYQEASGYTFVETSSFELANFSCEMCEQQSSFFVDAAFDVDDVGFFFDGRVIKSQRDKTLASGWFELFEQ